MVADPKPGFLQTRDSRKPETRVWKKGAGFAFPTAKVEVMWSGQFVCHFVILSVSRINAKVMSRFVILSVSRINAKVMSRFYQNLMLWLGLRVGRIINFWWGSGFGYGFWITFSVFLTIAELWIFRIIFISISHTVSGRFSRHLAIWLTPTG